MFYIQYETRHGESHLYTKEEWETFDLLPNMMRARIVEKNTKKAKAIFTNFAKALFNQELDWKKHPSVETF